MAHLNAFEAEIMAVVKAAEESGEDLPTFRTWPSLQPTKIFNTELEVSLGTQFFRREGYSVSVVIFVYVMRCMEELWEDPPLLARMQRLVRGDVLRADALRARFLQLEESFAHYARTGAFLVGEHNLGHVIDYVAVFTAPASRGKKMMTQDMQSWLEGETRLLLWQSYTFADGVHEFINVGHVPTDQVQETFLTGFPTTHDGQGSVVRLDTNGDAVSTDTFVSFQL